MSQREALGFAEEKAAWLRRNLEKQPVEVPVEVGGTVPFRGEMLRLVPAQARGVTLSAGQAGIAGDPARAGAKMQGFLKEAARARLVQVCDGYAATLGRGYASMSLRDTRSRWGSCSTGGGLMFSWRLIMAPDEILAYVAAHEVAHLKEMNHSPRFWAVVEALYGDHRAARAWLRKHGPELHRYRF
nr:SprT family zinc-dependent metalloprotease [Aquicoccus sp. G2-2]MEA1114979.1 SprT family zinc-dependent metalloprotease [Aquicoccus sp. G2-2]